jgi:hypothetical protein
MASSLMDLAHIAVVVSALEFEMGTLVVCYESYRECV